jgi:hypothetical protein
MRYQPAHPQLNISTKKIVVGGLMALGLGLVVTLPKVISPAQAFTQLAQVIENQPKNNENTGGFGTPFSQADIEKINNEPALEDSITITAIPPRLGDDGTLKAKPGEKIQASVRVRNSSKQTVRLESLVQDFVIGEDGSTPTPVDDTVSNRWSLASWTVLTPTSQTLKPGEVGQLTVLIEVPADALPGGHYAMVLHRPAVNQGQFELKGAASSGVNQRVGTLLYVMVDGPINEEAFVRNFTFPKFSEFGPMPFGFAVENGSDIHIKPQISIEIYNFFGKQVETIQIEPKNIFPLTSRSFEGQWDRVWGIGPYSARLVMSYGSQGQVAIAKTSFWLIPYRLVIAALVVIFSALAVLVVLRRHFLHRAANEQARIKQLEEKLEQLEHTQR